MREAACAIGGVAALLLASTASALFNGLPHVPIANGGFELHYPGPLVCVELEAPCAPSEQAVAWSSSPDVAFRDEDNSGDDEAVLSATGDAWIVQSFAGAHQAFSGHFDWFALTIERGTVPAGARVDVRLTQLTNPFVGPLPSCVLTLHGSLFGAGPRLRAAPFAGTLSDATPGDSQCDDEPAVWAASSMAERIAMLRAMRLVEVDLAGFRGAVIDDVAIEGATLAGGLVG